LCWFIIYNYIAMHGAKHIINILVAYSNLTCGELTRTANTKAIIRITITHKYFLKFGIASFMEIV